jgi:transglutaminase-like putative cysteine protease
MRIAVAHTTTYRYSEPVFLEPHVIRLRPRADGAQLLESFSLAIEPEPQGRVECLDAEGNAVTHAWFSQPTASLTARTMFRVETLRENPFEFLIDAGDRVVPLRYADPLRASLQPYLAGPADAGIREFGERIAVASNHSAMDFLANLNLELYGLMRHVTRTDGAPNPPEQTLTEREGSCRDAAALYCAICRTMGIAARFVSGYEFQGASQEQCIDLHAWAEVYLTGGGWRGYDPSRGLAAGASYIPLAAAASPEMAAPVSGTFRGSARAEMDYSISIQAL